MTMMSPPDDTLYQDLLKDYVAPVKDAGFTNDLMQQIAHASVQAQDRYGRLRRYAIAASALLGGLIASAQVPALVKMLSGWSLPETSLTPPAFEGIFANAPAPLSAFLHDLPISGWPLWVWPCLLGLGFGLWAVLDNRGFSDI